MSEKRKFTIIHRKTVSDGNYGSEQWGLIEEFTFDEHNMDYEADKMRDWVNARFKENQS